MVTSGWPWRPLRYRRLCCANHEPKAFLPKRKEPFTNAELRAMASVLEGTVLELSPTAVLVVDSKDRLWREVMRLLHIMAQTGLRLADALKLNADALWFELDDGRLPTIVQGLLTRFKREGNTVLLKPGRTKSDPLGTYWAPFLSTYQFTGRQLSMPPGRLYSLKQTSRQSLQLGPRHLSSGTERARD